MIGVDEPDPVSRSHEIGRHRHRRGLPHPLERAADGARVTEVVAHQPLHLMARLAGVSHQTRGMFLGLVVQHVLVALVLGVQDRAQAQQEFLRLVETGAIRRPAIDQRRIGQRGDGARGPEVAQRAGGVLDVRLQLVEGVVETRMPVVNQALQRVEDSRVSRRRADAGGDPFEQRPVAGDGARIEEGEKKLGVVDFELGEVVQLPNLMADRKVQVPQRMQDRAHASFFGRADRPVEQQEDVDVRLQTQLPPSVAAEGHDEAGAAGAWRFVKQPLQEVIDAVREALERGAPTVSTRRCRGQRVAGAFDA